MVPHPAAVDALRNGNTQDEAVDEPGGSPGDRGLNRRRGRVFPGSPFGFRPDLVHPSAPCGATLPRAPRGQRRAARHCGAGPVHSGVRGAVMRVTMTTTSTGPGEPRRAMCELIAARTWSWTSQAMSSARLPPCSTQRTSTVQLPVPGLRSARTPPAVDDIRLPSARRTQVAAAARPWLRLGCSSATPVTANAARAVACWTLASIVHESSLVC